MERTTDPAPPGRGNVTQTNAQTLHVHVHNILPQPAHSGQLAGRVLAEEDESALGGSEVEVYFGTAAGYPVTTTRTNPQGEFGVEDLPAGFYSLRIRTPGRPVAMVYNLRVRPGETARHTVRVPLSAGRSIPGGRTAREMPDLRVDLGRPTGDRGAN